MPRHPVTRAVAPVVLALALAVVVAPVLPAAAASPAQRPARAAPAGRPDRTMHAVRSARTARGGRGHATTTTAAARTTSGTRTRAATHHSTTTTHAAAVSPGPVQLHMAQAPRSTLTPPPLASTLAPAKMILSTNYDATDPSLLHLGHTYLLYTTGEGIGLPHIAVHVGPAIGTWTGSWDILPTLPPWASTNVWAPAVQRVQGGWALYFTATAQGTDPAAQCIGAAFSQKPTGPFVAEPQPFICQLDHRGSIDPRPFVDASGQLWMDWKSDDNADPNTPGPDQDGITGIWAQRLSPDGRVLLGTPTEIFRPDEEWEGTIVESPQMISVMGTYYLFFSANWFNQPYYGIGVAQCASVTGPCHTLGSGPILGSNLQGTGPGEPSVYVGSTGVYLLYTPTHADTPALTPPRPVAMARVGFFGLGPYLAAW